MDVLMFLADSCDAIGDQGLKSILGLAHRVVVILQIVIPIALIIWGTIDMGKAVIAGDEKKIKEARKPLIQRAVSAVIVFLLPYLVSLVIGLVIDGGQDWIDCWNASGSWTNKINTNIDNTNQ